MFNFTDTTETILALLTTFTFSIKMFYNDEKTFNWETTTVILSHMAPSDRIKQYLLKCQKR